MNRVILFVLVSISAGIFSPSSFAAATCGSEILSWPLGVTRSCGIMVQGDGQAPIGMKLAEGDPLNGGEAWFVCTEKGWTYESGSCALTHDFQCVKAELNRFNSSFFYDWSVEQIEQDLNSSNAHPKVIEFTNYCDQQKR